MGVGLEKILPSEMEQVFRQTFWAVDKVERGSAVS